MTTQFSGFDLSATHKGRGKPTSTCTTPRPNAEVIDLTLDSDTDEDVAKQKVVSDQTSHPAVLHDHDPWFDDDQAILTLCVPADQNVPLC